MFTNANQATLIPMKQPILKLSRHTGMIVAFQMQPIKVHGTIEQLRPIFVATQKHCILFGWWSIMSFFLINPATILLNAFNWYSYKRKYAKYVQFHSIAQSPIS